MKTWWLIDGALLRGRPEMELLAQRPDTVPLYRQWGDQATNVGPWLKSDELGFDPLALPLPARLGMSRFESALPDQKVVAHAMAIRILTTTDDGQPFFFRFADTRVLQAAKRSLSPGQLAQISGPLQNWTWTDRYGEPQVFPSGKLHGSTPLSLSLQELEALIDAGLPDRLLDMLEEIQESELGHLHEPHRFLHLEAAARFIAHHTVETFATQRSIARHAVLSSSKALNDPAFEQALREAMSTGDVGHLENWKPA